MSEETAKFYGFEIDDKARSAFAQKLSEEGNPEGCYAVTVDPVVRDVWAVMWIGGQEDFNIFLAELFEEIPEVKEVSWSEWAGGDPGQWMKWCEEKS